MKFKLLISNRDLKIKFNKIKNTLFIIYENQHTMRERERERERERDGYYLLCGFVGYRFTKIKVSNYQRRLMYN